MLHVQWLLSGPWNHSIVEWNIGLSMWKGLSSFFKANGIEDGSKK